MMSSFSVEDELDRFAHLRKTSLALVVAVLNHCGRAGLEATNSEIVWQVFNRGCDGSFEPGMKSQEATNERSVVAERRQLPKTRLQRSLVINGLRLIFCCN